MSYTNDSHTLSTSTALNDRELIVIAKHVSTDMAKSSLGLTQKTSQTPISP